MKLMTLVSNADYEKTISTLNSKTGKSWGDGLVVPDAREIALHYMDCTLSIGPAWIVPEGIKPVSNDEFIQRIVDDYGVPVFGPSIRCSPDGSKMVLKSTVSFDEIRRWESQTGCGLNTDNKAPINSDFDFKISQSGETAYIFKIIHDGQILVNGKPASDDRVKSAIVDFIEDNEYPKYKAEVMRDLIANLEPEHLVSAIRKHDKGNE